MVALYSKRRRQLAARGSAANFEGDGEHPANLNRGCARGFERIVRRQLTRTFAPHFATTRISTRDCFFDNTGNRRGRVSEAFVGARKSNCRSCPARTWTFDCATAFGTNPVGALLNSTGKYLLRRALTCRSLRERVTRRAGRFLSAGIRAIFDPKSVWAGIGHERFSFCVSAHHVVF